MADRDDEELAELADELADVLRELRDELRENRHQREQSGGLDIDLPSPPSPGELLTFTDEQLIPAAIAILEANIRALELLQSAIRLARPGRAGEHASSVRSGAESLSRSTLERLDDVLVDLQDAAAEGGLPPDSEARDVVTEARRLRNEIDDALAERTDEPEDEGDQDEPEEGEETEQDDEDESDPFGFEEQPEVDVDVEGELESIKAELGKVEEEPDQPRDEEGAADADADDSATDGVEDEDGEQDEDDTDEQDDDDGRDGADDDERDGADGDDE